MQHDLNPNNSSFVYDDENQSNDPIQIHCDRKGLKI